MNPLVVYALGVTFCCACAGWTVWWGYLLYRRGGLRRVLAVVMWVLAAGLLLEVAVQFMMNRP